MRTEQASENTLPMLLKALRLPTFAALFQEAAQKGQAEGLSLTQYLRYLAESEVEDRRRRRIERLKKRSKLPSEKTISSFDLARLPQKIQRQVPVLLEGHFLKRTENILAFGLPGRGKTHLLAAIGHELVRRGHAVFFTPVYQLVQRLLAAKRELILDKELRKLDRFEAVIIDDMGYVQQDREEMEVLFTFLAERYERKSVMISSNLVFSQWDRIFKDSMTTAAAIDRLVHHCTILELTGPSFRTQEAKQNAKLVNDEGAKEE
jgi:DNA replication protein DnaC